MKRANNPKRLKSGSRTPFGCFKNIPRSNTRKMPQTQLELAGKSQRMAPVQFQVPKGMQPLSDQEMHLIQLYRKTSKEIPSSKNSQKKSQHPVLGHISALKAEISKLNTKDLESLHMISLGKENAIEEIPKRPSSSEPIKEDSKIGADDSDSEDYSIKVRSPQEKLGKETSHPLTPKEKNHLNIYKQALKDAATENDLLRSEIIASRRKTVQLEIQNNEMKDAIVELSESLDILTNGKLVETLNID
ncbi:unnamed protein product [Moneuplotes crassus]|uniref:Uncharacterized protein n=1 Tax=Euplotes crassus TaxID=5936 RepID=A0AAD1UF47_EUPCR|nr:unnamed protein product [Moneuplotes crassus]